MKRQQANSLGTPSHSVLLNISHLLEKYSRYQSHEMTQMKVTKN